MQKALAFAICLSAACSGASSLPVEAGAETPLNPFAEIVEIPPELCPPLGGYLAMTPRGARALMDADIERERQCKSAVARAETAARVADAQRSAALEALEHAQWWERWGPIVVLSVGFVSAALGAAGGAVIERTIRR